MPKSKTDPAKITDAAAELIRDLNYATPKGLEYPGDIYKTVANLKILAQRLPQSFEQTLAGLDTMADTGNLTSDTNTLPEDLADARLALLDAASAARSLEDALDRAHSALGPIGWNGGI